MRGGMDRQLAGLRIGAYARFSSDKQSETSASAQLARLEQWVQARGGRLSLQHTYRDEGISGATNQRPGLISIMAAVDPAIDFSASIAPAGSRKMRSERVSCAVSRPRLSA